MRGKLKASLSLRQNDRPRTNGKGREKGMGRGQAPAKRMQQDRAVTAKRGSAVSTRMSHGVLYCKAGITSVVYDTLTAERGGRLCTLTESGILVSHKEGRYTTASCCVAGEN